MTSFPYFDSFSSMFGVGLGVLSVVFVLLMLIALVLKGFAMWHAARNYQPYWFVALLVINTLGILEVVYLIWFRKDKRSGETKSLFNAPSPSNTDVQ